MINNHIEQLLEEFIHSFFGYGNFDGEYWFIGIASFTIPLNG